MGTKGTIKERTTIKTAQLNECIEITNININQMQIQVTIQIKIRLEHICYECTPWEVGDTHMNIFYEL